MADEGRKSPTTWPEHFVIDCSILFKGNPSEEELRNRVAQLCSTVGDEAKREALTQRIARQVLDEVEESYLRAMPTGRRDDDGDDSDNEAVDPYEEDAGFGVWFDAKGEMMGMGSIDCCGCGKHGHYLPGRNGE